VEFSRPRVARVAGRLSGGAVGFVDAAPGAMRGPRRFAREAFFFAGDACCFVDDAPGISVVAREVRG